MESTTASTLNQIASLSHGSLLLVLPITLALYLSGYVVYQLYFSPLAKFPGPFWAKLTDVWRARVVSQGSQNKLLMELHKRHGPVVRIGPNQVSVGDLETFRRIYGVKNALTKSYFYEAMATPRSFEVFAERVEKVHGARRRLISRMYSVPALKEYEPRVGHLLTLFVEKLREKDGQEVLMGPYLEHFAFDFICEITFSLNYGFVASNENGGFIMTIRKRTNFVFVVGQVWWFQHLLFPLLDVLGKWTPLKNPTEKISAMISKAYQERIQKTKFDTNEAPDMMRVLLERRESGQMSEADIRASIRPNIVVGVSDMAVFLNAVFYHLVHNPEKAALLRKELLERRRNGLLSEVVMYEEAEQIPYLQAVLLESLRLHPVSSGVMERDVPVGGMDICGHYVPAGMVVGTTPWVIHRDPSIYGDDPNDFRPERWLDESRKTEMHKYFFAFGGGTRTCIGRNLAMMEAGKLVGTVIQQLDFTKSEKHPTWTTTAGASVHQDDFYAMVRAL